jgi:hypothetical protein
MSPIDDELRAALHGRARVLDPAPTRWPASSAGQRMQRNRIGAAVAGSALAVTAVAGVVPLLQGTSPVPDRPPVATAAPTLEPSPEPSVTASPQAPDLSYALDPQDPWAFRGEPVEEGTRATIQDEYATKLQADEVLVTPLFASTYEPSGQQEVVFLARVDGGYRWGISTSSEAGPEFLWDEPLPEPALALTARLAGDEVDRLVVLTAPGTEVQYRAARAATWTGTWRGDGSGVGPLEGDVSPPSYRVLDPRGGPWSRPRSPVPARRRPTRTPSTRPTPWPTAGRVEPSARTSRSRTSGCSSRRPVPRRRQLEPSAALRRGLRRRA